MTSAEDPCTDRSTADRSLETGDESPLDAVVVERGAFVDSAGNPNERVRYLLDN